MNIFKKFFLFKKHYEIDNEVNHGLVDQYGEIARLVKEARIQKHIICINFKQPLLRSLDGLLIKYIL